jgi:hypothetical protein
MQTARTLWIEGETGNPRTMVHRLHPPHHAVFVVCILFDGIESDEGGVAILNGHFFYYRPQKSAGFPALRGKTVTTIRRRNKAPAKN